MKLAKLADVKRNKESLLEWWPRINRKWHFFWGGGTYQNGWTQPILQLEHDHPQIVTHFCSSCWILFISSFVHNLNHLELKSSNVRGFKLQFLHLSLSLSFFEWKVSVKWCGWKFTGMSVLAVTSGKVTQRCGQCNHTYSPRLSQTNMSGLDFFNSKSKKGMH